MLRLHDFILTVLFSTSEAQGLLSHHLNSSCVFLFPQLSESPSSSHTILSGFLLSLSVPPIDGLAAAEMLQGLQSVSASTLNTQAFFLTHTHTYSFIRSRHSFLPVFV